jgi:hypothetical protein
MQLELTGQETEVLSETLQIQLSELSGEIANTDKQDFREELKRKRDLLKAIQQRLS